MSDTTPRVPGLNPALRQAPRIYAAPTAGTIDERLADISRELNTKANRAGIPNFTAIQLTGENGLPYLLYVDAAGTLRVTPVTK